MALLVDSIERQVPGQTGPFFKHSGPQSARAVMQGPNSPMGRAYCRTGSK
jgi:hypothetical protein